MRVSDKIENSFAKNIINRLAKLIPEEEVLGIYRANNFWPVMDAVAITSTHIIGIANDTNGNIKFAKESSGGNIASVAIGKRNRLMFYVSILITTKDGKTSKFADVHKNDVDEAVGLVQKIIGKTTSISILTRQDEEKAAERERELQEQIKREKEAAELAATTTQQHGHYEPTRKRTIVKTFGGLGNNAKQIERYANKHDLRVVSMTTNLGGVKTVIFESND